jgi:predicted RNA binding protein YcfA (HicA-like mRNA interferase family)
VYLPFPFFLEASDNRSVKPKIMKVRDAMKMVEGDGWRMVNQEGSHRQYKHPSKKGRVTIAGHPSMDLDPKTQNSILKQAGLK